jgi:2-C-methyl-D-erythritol 4-phosphate cytidylyltransferase
MSAESNQNIYAIILASGYSTRFGGSMPKQIYNLNGKPVIQHSMDSLLPLNPIKIIIITNDICFPLIKKLVNQYTNPNAFEIIVNQDKDSMRMDSLGLGLKYLKSIECDYNSKIIIHDGARPHVTTCHYQTLIDEMKNDLAYTQYCLKINGGLINSITFDIVNRENYLEMVTPIAIKYNVFKEIYDQHLDWNPSRGKRNYEFIPFLKEKKYSFKFITGTYRILRKITTFDDLD